MTCRTCPSSYQERMVGHAPLSYQQAGPPNVVYHEAYSGHPPYATTCVPQCVPECAPEGEDWDVALALIFGVILIVAAIIILGIALRPKPQGSGVGPIPSTIAPVPNTTGCSAGDVRWNFGLEDVQNASSVASVGNEYKVQQYTNIPTREDCLALGASAPAYATQSDNLMTLPLGSFFQWTPKVGRSRQPLSSGTCTKYTFLGSSFNGLDLDYLPGAAVLLQGPAPAPDSLHSTTRWSPPVFYGAHDWYVSPTSPEKYSSSALILPDGNAPMTQVECEAGLQSTTVGLFSQKAARDSYGTWDGQQCLIFNQKGPCGSPRADQLLLKPIPSGAPPMNLYLVGWPSQFTGSAAAYSCPTINSI